MQDESFTSTSGCKSEASKKEEACKNALTMEKTGPDAKIGYSDRKFEKGGMKEEGTTLFDSKHHSLVHNYEDRSPLRVYFCVVFRVCASHWRPQQ